MDDLVVRQREHEVLGVGVDLPERELAVMVATVDRLASDVLQRVVHPSHVPLELESEAADVRGTRHHRPRRRFLRERLRSGVLAVDVLVQPAEEGHGLEVLTAAVDVREPLAGLAE